MGALLDCWRKDMKVSIDVRASRMQDREVGTSAVRVGVGGLVHGPFSAILRQLAPLGYEEGKNAFAAPFDWRRGPSYWQSTSWPALKASIEAHVARSGQPAVVLGMSLGCPYFVAFLLHHQGISAAWKRKHVKGFVSLSGLYDGAASALSFSLWGQLWPGPPEQSVGAEMYHELLPESAQAVLGPLMEGWGAVAWLLPRRQRTLLELPREFKGNVSTAMLASLLHEASPVTAELYRLGRRFETTNHPGVKVFCFFGNGKSAPASFSYLGGSKPRRSAGARERAELAAMTAEGELAKEGLHLDKEQLTSVVGGVAGLLEAPRVAARERPRAQGEPGSQRWLAAAAALLRDFVPLNTTATQGDGIVERESLAVCEHWRGVKGLPDAEVKELQGLGHAEESRDGAALRMIKETVATLAGVNTSALPMDCEAKRLACPAIRRQELCTKSALQGMLRSTDDCCRDAERLQKCMGTACMTTLLAEMADGDDSAEAAEDAWRQGCHNVTLPTKRAVRAAMHRPKKENCLAKVPGHGCPPLLPPGCAERAMSGHVSPSCCAALRRSLDCIGGRCLSVGLGVVNGLGASPLLPALQRGCREPRLGMANGSRAVQQLLPAGAVAAAAQLFKSLQQHAAAVMAEPMAEPEAEEEEGASAEEDDVDDASIADGPPEGDEVQVGRWMPAPREMPAMPEEEAVQAEPASPAVPVVPARPAQMRVRYSVPATLATLALLLAAITGCCVLLRRYRRRRREQAALLQGEEAAAARGGEAYRVMQDP